MGIDKVDQGNATFYGYAPDGKGNNVVAGQTVSGNVIKIINYYYHEDTQIKTEEKTDEYLPCPYRGLYHFSPQDAEFFFGRDVFIEALYKAVQSRNFVAVLGASGSGKSSVVFAGLVPRLVKETHWLFTHFRPGGDPFFALAMALVPLYNDELNNTEHIAQARQLTKFLLNKEVNISDVLTQIQQKNFNQKILIIGDQFEELYTLCKNLEIRSQFLDCLIECLSFSQGNSSSRITIVITMRADFLGSALGYRPVANKINDNNVMLGAMDEQEIRDVIIKPAEKKGVSFQDGLVERIFDSVKKESGSLPLLEFALTLLWEKREGKLLTHKAYEDIGEVEGALANYADDQFKDLNETEKELTRRIFIQLVRPGEGTEDTRRVSVKDEIGEANWELVKKLADSRLVVTSKEENQQETVEVVHETLIRNWNQLRQWMEKHRDFRAWQERLRSAKELWEANDQDKGSLLRGAALVEAEEKFKKRPEDLISEQAFIEESIKEKTRLEQEEKQRQKRELEAAQKLAQTQTDAATKQKEANKKLLLRAIGLGIVSFIALVTAAWAWNQTRIAELTLANSLARTSLSLFAEHKELEAFVEAIRAGKILQKQHKTDPETLSALQQTLYEGSERNRLENHDNFVYSVSFSPDGKTLASGSADKTIKIWDLETGQEIPIDDNHKDYVHSVSFSPDGQTLASGSADNTIKIWDLEDLETATEIRTLDGHDDPVYSISFSPDGQMLASGSADKTIKIWDLKTGTEIRTLGGHDDPVYSISFSPDGKTLASSSADTTIKIWDLATGEDIRTLDGHQSYVYSVSFSPDGKTLASGGLDQTIKIWDSNTGKEIRTLNGHDDRVRTVSFSPDGQTLVSGSQDSTLKIWNLETDTFFEGHNDLVNSIDFSPDGKILASGSFDTTVKLWDSETGKEINHFQGHSNWVYSVSFSPDGKTLASGSYDKTIKIWDLDTGQESLSLQGHSSLVYGITFSPDGKTLASGSGDNIVKIWDLKTGKEIVSLHGHDDSIFNISFSPDGKILASGSKDETIKLWDLKTGKIIRTLEGHEGYVYSVSFSPNGQTLVSASHDKTIKIWDVNTGEEIHTLDGHDNHVRSVSFSPDGKMLASGGDDQTIKFWDIEKKKEILTLKQNSYINSVSFSPDGRTLAFGTKDKKVKIWKIDLNLDSLIKRNCDWVYHYLQSNRNIKKEDKHLCDGIIDISSNLQEKNV